MSWKGAVIIVVILVGLVLGVGVYKKLTQSTEVYKAKEQVYYSPTYNFAPLSFGCASFRVEAAKVQEKIIRGQNRTTTNTTNAIPKKTLLD